MNKSIISFDDAPEAERFFYGGNAGAKEAIIYDNAVWMIKYPKTTRDLVKPQISYTTSPLSEYLGTKIYESLGLPVHEVLLGVRKNKVVVACKDFTQSDVAPVKAKTLIPFHDLKNRFMANDLDEYSGTGSETFLDEVLATIEGEKNLKKVGGVLERFWDMFVVDAFIDNNDRNNGNWGLLEDNTTGKIELTPIYDNGNAFFNKKSLKQMQSRLENESWMQEDAYKSPTCVYKYRGLDSDSYKIHPFEFIRKGDNDDCTRAVSRFLKRLDMDKIRTLIHNIPKSTGSLSVMPHIQKEFYLELLKIRLEQLKLGVD